MKELNPGKAMVIFSGGQDSTTCLGWAVKCYGRKNTEAITFDYGQRHWFEIEQSKSISKMFSVKHKIIRTNLFENIKDSALLDRDLDVNEIKDGLPASFVPGRNNFFILAAAMLAYKKDIKNIVAGVCQTDYSGYPDCRQESINAVEKAVNLCMEADFKIHTPLMNLSKAETFSLAESFGCLDIVVDYSATCYEGSTHINHWGMGCGQCSACKLRKKGFDEYCHKKA